MYSEYWSFVSHIHWKYFLSVYGLSFHFVYGFVTFSNLFLFILISDIKQAIENLGSYPIKRQMPCVNTVVFDLPVFHITSKLLFKKSSSNSKMIPATPVITEKNKINFGLYWCERHIYFFLLVLSSSAQKLIAYAFTRPSAQWRKNLSVWKLENCSSQVWWAGMPEGHVWNLFAHILSCLISFSLSVNNVFSVCA